MKVYQYNQEGYLLSIFETNDEEYLLDEGSTLVPIPELNENQTCRFDGVVWLIVDKPAMPETAELPTAEERLTAIEDALLMIL